MRRNRFVVLLVCVLSALAVCLLVAGGKAMAERQTIKLKTGGQITGQVEKVEGGYEVVTDAGLKSRINDDQVADVITIVTPEDLYQKQAAGKDLKNPQVRYELGKWADDQGYFDIAKRELTEALKLKHDYEMASVRLQLVQSKIDATTRPAAVTSAPTTRTAVTSAPTVQTLDKSLVSLEDVYRIRLYELRQTDNLPVTMKGDVVDRYIKQQQGKGDFATEGFADRFRRANDIDKVRHIMQTFDVRDGWDIKEDVQIKGDPPFMVEYRKTVMAMISAKCASDNCHGGLKAVGGWQMFRTGQRELVDYTNFYVLSNYAKGGMRIIDRGQPDASLLLQYGLPRDIAKFRHPTEISPMFTGVQDPKYKQVMDWITSLKNVPPFQGYPVSYKPPFDLPNTAEPAAAPAAPAAPATAPAK